jgi:hypothetical protein
MIFNLVLLHTTINTTKYMSHDDYTTIDTTKYMSHDHYTTIDTTKYMSHDDYTTINTTKCMSHDDYTTIDTTKYMSHDDYWPMSTIETVYNFVYCAVSFIGGKPGENNLPVASNWNLKYTVGVYMFHGCHIFVTVLWCIAP